MSRLFVTSLSCIGSLVIACASHDANDEATAGQISLAIAASPSDVQCLVITATGSGRTVSRPIGVTPGQSINTSISGLPTGSVAVGANAYPTVCSAVTATSAATWLSDPATQTVTLSKGTTVAVNLVLRPSASINATVDWQDDSAGGAGGAGGSSSTGGTSTGGTTGTGVAVQLSQTDQTIQGFGVSDIWASSAFSTTVADALFTTTGTGIGLSILRVGMSESGGLINGSATSDISAIKSRVTDAKIIGTVYSPPASCKTNNNVNDGGHLLTSCYDSWSTTITNFARANTLYAMSLQNEPDFATCGTAEPCNGNYPSTLYTANEMVAFAKVAGPKLKAAGVKVIAPEVSQWNRAWSNVSATGSVPSGMNSPDPFRCGFPPNSATCTTGGGYDYGHYLANDATAWAAFDIFGTHEYASQTSTPWASDVTAAKKEVWMTEMSGIKWWPEQGPSSDINNGVVVARWIHSALVDGQASAWLYWAYQYLTDDNEGLILRNGTDTKRHYTLGNFSKFVRPGYVRVAVTGNSSSDLLLSAYKGTDGKVVVVAVNQGTSAVIVPIAITGGTAPTSVTPWVTSSTDNLASKTAITVSGGSFTANLPGLSVTTFVSN